jgi:hypothetical protein
MVIAYTPVPDPLLIFELDVVGLLVVLQHIPRVVTAAPPSEITLPPEVAELKVRSDIAVVFTVDTEATVFVVKVRSLP